MFFGAGFVSAQNPVQPPVGQIAGPQTPAGLPGMDRAGLGNLPGLSRMNPSILIKMREDMAFEIQQTQRMLGVIDPNDKQMLDTLKQQQEELTRQIKDINEQLKAQGVPVDGQQTTEGTNSPAVPAAGIPNVPRALDPTMVSGGLSQTPTDPNLLIQRPGTMSGQMQPGMPGGMGTMHGTVQPGQLSPNMQQGMGMMMPIQPTPPTEFDQDQAWANSPWTPQPSKELGELKQTVDSLRKELVEMKENIKALETQIQLLNRNILLSQPAK